MGNVHISHSYYSVVVYTQITGNNVGVCQYDNDEEEGGCGCKSCMEYEKFQDWYKARSYFFDILLDRVEEMNEKREEKRIIMECEQMQKNLIDDIIKHEILTFIPTKKQIKVEKLNLLSAKLNELNPVEDEDEYRRTLDEITKLNN